MKRISLIALSAALLLTTTAISTPSDVKWQKLFDGKTLNGWRLMAVHGGKGGVWVVENGALVADQDNEHKGGLLATEKKYSDFEIELEFKVDFPADSGLFLRTRDDGMGYQITVDNTDGGFIGSLYLPAEGVFKQQNKNWVKLFRKDEWNKLRARVEGYPAHVTSWLNGVVMSNFKDDIQRYPREGYIGLQVHGGEGSWGTTSKARFRNIRITELNRAASANQ
jgi:Domain of Unknown Function (DUF1080)